MAGQSIIKRPSIYTLSELERYPTLNDIYAATLPFSENTMLCKWPVWQNHYRGNARWLFTPPSWVIKSIKRTQERWTWFSSARALDDERGEGLGTLRYLPWEIRQEILKVLIHMDACDHRTELITKRMIAGTIYPPHFARSTSCFYGMRLASPSTKVEFEYYYLTKSDFKFKTPRDLETFLDRLSVNQQSLLRSFTFDLFAKWNIVDPRDWAAVFTRLPSNLISIQFSLYSANLSAFKTDGHWFIWDHGTLTVHRAARLLEMLGKRARRYAARAKIGLSDCCLDPKDIARMREHIAQGRDEVVGVLHDLEPWSENWLGWWEESTKIDMDNG